MLVLDVNRYNQTFGQERPGGEAMGPKLDAMLKDPPAGVQVWSSCIAKQRSYAADDYPIGVFLDSLLTALNKGLSGGVPICSVSDSSSARLTATSAGAQAREAIASGAGGTFLSKFTPDSTSLPAPSRDRRNRSR